MGIMSVVSSVRSALSPAPTTPTSTGSSVGYTPVKWYQFSLRSIILFFLPLLSLTGFYGTMVLGASNGTFPSITELVAGDEPHFPGTTSPLLKSFTGSKAIDHQLSILVTFFAPTVDLSHGPLFLFTLLGFGQFGAAWTLLVMESMRMGNRGKIVGFIGTVGFILQNISFAVTIPMYLFIHLLSSPVAKPFPGTYANSVLLVSSLDLTILPVTITLSYIIPSLLMGLFSPDIVSSVRHQQYIAFWQGFPIWTVIIHWSLRISSQYISTKVSKDNQPPAPLGASYLNKAKHVYRFVLTLCITTQVPVLLIMFLPSSAVPDHWPTIKGLARCNFLDIFVPYFPLPSYKVSNFGAGVLNFLQWDVYVGSTSLLLWVILLYKNATAEKTIVDPSTSLPKYRELLSGERAEEVNLWKKLAWKIGGWTLVSGPMGALTILLWQRDAIVRQKIKQGI